eukprot:COSAG02_NODE_6080_length_3815_cov_25.833961_1_plen_105_part_00
MTGAAAVPAAVDSYVCAHEVAGEAVANGELVAWYNSLAVLWIGFVAALDELANLGARAFRYALVETTDNLLAARECLLESACGDGKVEEGGQFDTVLSTTPNVH